MDITKAAVLERMPLNIDDLTYPCQCPQCRKPSRTRSEPAQKPLATFLPPKITALVELTLPSGSSLCSKRKDHIIWSPAVADPAVYYRRALAFLYRIMTFAGPDPDPTATIRSFIAEYRSRMYVNPRLPVPLSTLAPILTPAPHMTSDLARLSKLSRALRDDHAIILQDFRLLGRHGYETWHASPAIAAGEIDMFVPWREDGIIDLARKCSAPDAHTNPSKAVRTVAERAVFDPHPLLDYWPWVPGWAVAPDLKANLDHLDKDGLTRRTAGRPVKRSVGDCVIPMHRRRWWNYNRTPWEY